MNHIKHTMIAVLALFGLSTAAMAELIVGGAHDGTNVGGVDTIIAETSTTSCTVADSGQQSEIDWVNCILGTSFDASNFSKEQNVDFFNTTTTDVIAFMLQSGPGYYLIKNARIHVLLENVANFDWGVVDRSQIGGRINLNEFNISHVSEFGGSTTTTVPEPGTLALLGLGLIGAGFARRRRVTPQA